MISYIRGELVALEEDKVIVDVGGVGYGIFMSGQAMGQLPPVGSKGHLFTSQKSAGVVEIQIDGKVVETLDLQKERAFKINGGTNTVQIENGKVKMAAANCPDQICVHQKAISRNGESIICLPNKIVLKIVDGEEAELDAVTN